MVYKRNDQEGSLRGSNCSNSHTRPRGGGKGAVENEEDIQDGESHGKKSKRRPDLHGHESVWTKQKQGGGRDKAKDEKVAKGPGTMARAEGRR